MAPTTAGTNAITQTEDILIDHLAGLSEFQTLTGTGDATAAKTHIYVESFGDFDTIAELEAKMPYVLISPLEDSPQIMFKLHAARYQFIQTHHYQLSFWRELSRPSATDIQDLEREWKNAVGDVMEAFVSSAGDEGKFGANEVWPISPAAFDWEDTKQYATQVWDWGVQRTVEDE